jgi:hypothetical protein
LNCCCTGSWLVVELVVEFEVVEDEGVVADEGVVVDWLLTVAGWLELMEPVGGGMNTVDVFCGITPAYMLDGSEAEHAVPSALFWVTPSGQHPYMLVPHCEAGGGAG